MPVSSTKGKVLLISTGVLSVAMLLKLSVPLILEFATSDVPVLYSSALSWLRPPYLYLLINCIIISIVASSKFLHKSEDGDDTPLEIVPQPHPPVKIAADYTVLEGVVSSGYGLVTEEMTNVEEVVREVDPLTERIYASPLDQAIVTETPERKSFKDEEVAMNIRDFPSKEVLDPSPRMNDSMESVMNWNDKENEKPPVSARFAHRKALKSSPEGKGLRRVTKPKRQDTLESTWRTITEGRGMPLARHLKKSDTLETHARRNSGQNDPNPDPIMKKSDTFQDRSGGGGGNAKTPTPTFLSPSPVSGKVRKEPSLSQDELNRRVEAFIKKFNEEMRLQREESLNQYQEMIGRGAR